MADIGVVNEKSLTDFFPHDLRLVAQSKTQRNHRVGSNGLASRTVIRAMARKNKDSSPRWMQLLMLRCRALAGGLGEKNVGTTLRFVCADFRRRFVSGPADPSFVATVWAFNDRT